MCVWLLSEYSLCCLCSLYCSRYELPLPPPRSTSLMLLSGWVGWLQGSFGGETNAHVVLCWWGRLLYRSEIQHSFSFYVFHSVRQTGWGRRVSNFFFDFSFFFFPSPTFYVLFCLPVVLSSWSVRPICGCFYLCQLFLGDGSSGWRLRLPSTSLFPYRPVFILIIQIIPH